MLKIVEATMKKKGRKLDGHISQGDGGVAFVRGQISRSLVLSSSGQLLTDSGSSGQPPTGTTGSGAAVMLHDSHDSRFLSGKVP